MNSNKRDIVPESDCGNYLTPAPVAELPKDAEGKAKELMEKFLTKVGQECEHDSYCDKPECCYNGIVHCVVNLDIAKQCALICVDEILNCKHGWNKETSSFVTYWQQVRTAINQL
ncbi:MAG TPA: hypothetical protein PLX17_00535 [Chitinophagaceae bacterium]|nr:hypothetical protein [Chitinophagaceae bacterium]